MRNSLFKTKQKLKNDKWYKQGLPSVPLTGGFPLKVIDDFAVKHRKIASKFLGLISFMSNDYWGIYFPSAASEPAYFYLIQQKKNHRFIYQAREHWEKYDARPLHQIIKKIRNRKFNQYTDKELLDLFLRFSRLCNQMWRGAIFLDSYDLESDKILEQIFIGDKRVFSEEEINILTFPINLSWLQREKKDLLVLTKLALRQKLVNNKLSTLPLRFRQRLQDHANQYYWIYNDYIISKHLGPGFFWRRAQALAKNKKELFLEADAIKKVKTMAAKKQALFKKLHLSKQESNVISYLVYLADWRDSRKAYNQMSNGLVLDLSFELARRRGVDVEQVRYLFWWEVSDFFMGKMSIKKLLHLYKKRKNAFLCLGKPDKDGKVFYGNEARALSNFLDNLIAKQALRGRCAYPGVARGRVKIIRSQADFKKIKSSDILLASNTRPDYVPIMKIASAIVTEEGGITSHAAIVSRELKTPCIVGAQGILGILKDGDRVEVDAERGLVTKIK